MTARYIAVILLIGLLGACDKTQTLEVESTAVKPAATAAVTTNAAEPDILAKLPESIALMKSAKCSASDQGETSCVINNYDIGIFESGCSADGLYGAVSAKEGALLVDSIIPAEANSIAKLQDKQIVCIEASAQQGKDPASWHYVRAIPVKTIAGCKDNNLCNTYGDRAVSWIKPASGKPCVLDAAKKYVGDCAAGWIKADEFEEFSMGLNP